MNSITKLTTLTLIGALAVTSAGARVREAEPIPVEDRLATTTRTIVKKAYHQARRVSRRAAYESYRKNLRLEDVEGFADYILQSSDLTRDGMSTRERRPESWNRSYEMYERMARQDAFVAARKAFAKGMAQVKLAARKLARQEVDKGMAKREIRMRMSPVYRRAIRALGPEKAKALAAEAVEQARTILVEKATAKYEAQLAEKNLEDALQAGYEEYAKLEEQAYRRGKHLLHEATQESAPKSEVETESAPEEETAPLYGPARPPEADSQIAELVDIESIVPTEVEGLPGVEMAPPVEPEVELLPAGPFGLPSLARNTD